MSEDFVTTRSSSIHPETIAVISTLGSPVHAVLKASHHDYQNSTDIEYKTSIASLVESLLGTNKSNIPALAVMLNVDIYVLRSTNGELQVVYWRPTKSHASIVLLEPNPVDTEPGSGGYRTIGVVRSGKIQTLFANDDPFIRNLVSASRNTKDLSDRVSWLLESGSRTTKNQIRDLIETGSMDLVSWLVRYKYATPDIPTQLDKLVRYLGRTDLTTALKELSKETGYRNIDIYPLSGILTTWYLLKNSQVWPQLNTEFQDMSTEINTASMVIDSMIEQGISEQEISRELNRMAKDPVSLF